MVLEVELERMETAFALAGEASPEQLDIYARVLPLHHGALFGFLSPK
jgi:hypothetical protein